jgi:hypothetical protein
MLTFMADNKSLTADYSMVTGSENAQFPLTNIKHDFTTKVFRSNETAVAILVDLQATSTVDSFCIVGSSVAGLGLGDMTIQGSATTNFTGATVIPVDIDAAYNFGFKLFDAASFRYWKLTINNTAGSYVEISNIYIGEKTQITTNGFSTPSFAYTSTDNSSIKRNRYGQRFIDSYNRINTLSGTVEHATQAEFTEINDVYMQNGTTTPIYFILDPDGTTATDGEFLFSGYFYLTNDLAWTYSGPQLYNISITLEEAT